MAVRPTDLIKSDASGWAPSDDSGGASWIVAYELDFSGQGNNDFETGASFTMEGVRWYPFNHTQTSGVSGFPAEGFYNKSGAGLQIWPQSDERMFQARLDLPIIAAKVKDLVSGELTYDVDKHAVCFQVTCTASPDIANNYDAFGALAFDGVPATPKYIGCRSLWDGSALTDIIWNTHGANAQSKIGEATFTNRNLFQITIWPGGPAGMPLISAAIGPMPGGGDFPDPHDWVPINQGSISYGKQNDATTFTKDTLHVGVHAQCENAAVTEPKPTFTKCRALVMDLEQT